MDYKPGDTVKVKTGKEEHTGILMPNEETDSVVIKLDSGYNIGISKKNVKKIELVKKYSKKDGPGKKPARHDKKKPTIFILHTGGTIASKVDYGTGGVIARFSPQELISMFPELDSIVNIESKLISNMWSDDMRFCHYSLMAKEVKKAIDKGADGIIITHGTDTIGYTAAALSFMLEDLPVPVILVGAQRSSDRGSSDAAMNLICAAYFIAKTDFADVAVCMHETEDDNNCLVLPGTKTRKLHSSRRDAFRAVNDKPIARINYDTKKVDLLTEYRKKSKRSSLKVKDKMEDKVAILKVHTNMFPKQFEFYKNEKYKGLVIEGTGLGHAPVGAPDELSSVHRKNLKAIQGLVDSGCIVVMTSQTIFGRVHMHVYNNGIYLAGAGVISGSDMLAETAFVKLAWLLGNYPKEKAKELMGKNLRGEINERLVPEEWPE